MLLITLINNIKPIKHMIAAKQFKAIITDIIGLSPTTKHFRLEIIDDKIKKEFDFVPGQFIIIDFKDIDEEGVKGIVKRSFSIASAPEDKNYIDLCIKLTPNGKITPKLFETDIGSVLDCAGAYGNFFYQHAEGRDVILIAGGTGIAPIRSMIRHLIKTKNNSFTTFLFSFRGSNEFLYKEELETYENKHPDKFRLITTNTDMDDKEWDGLYGRMQEHLPVFISNTDNKDVYICGPPEFVTEIVNKLLYLGFAKGQIKKEVWS